MISACSQLRRAVRLVCGSIVTICTAASVAQVPVRRLSQVPANTESRAAVPGSVTARPKTSQMVGHLSGDTALTGISLILKPTAAQDDAMTQLIADQQNPASPSYHQWLTPAQFGARFGVADEDLAVLQSWLTNRGFTVESVAASRNRIVFSGTASAVENAFGVSLERYQRDGQTYFENSSEVTLPASISGVIGGVTGLSSYHLTPSSRIRDLPQDSVVKPLYTTSTGTHYLVPWDFRQIFAMNPLISSGFDGSNITIGVLGQSTVDTAQLTYFQQKTGQTVKLPTMMQVPSTGTAGRLSTDDESESELDLEYASGSAPGATVLFIYTGLGSSRGATDGNNNGVFDSMAYAITSNLAPILTLSYGACEPQVATYATSTMEPLLRQGNTQGQTIVISSGDSGATSCETAASSAAKVAVGGLSVSYPASSPYVTAVGGTQLNGNTSTYWSSTNNSFAGSAIGYIPEVSWNDTANYSSGIASSGGGASAIFAKPSWQVGTNVPADGHRDIPDVSFPSAILTNPYIVCTVGGTCNSNAGFGSGTGGGGGGLIGGTSAAAPNFAALLAVVEQANGGGRLGNVNPSLYSLASGASAGTIFHDVTSGNNIVTCRGGTTGCSSTNASANGTMGYTAGVGYDLVTGLGSLAANTLQPALKTITAATPLTPTVSLTATPTSPATSVAVTFSAAVSGTGSVPSGTITFAVDGTTAGTATLGSGLATYSYAGFATAGTHVVTATYSGNPTYYGASASLSITVTGTGGATAGITLATSSNSVTAPVGGTTTNLITATSTGSFAGTVSYRAAITSSNGANFSGCYTVPNGTLAAGGSVASTIMIQTTSTGCTSTSIRLGSAPLTVARTISSQESWPGPGGLAVFSAGLMGFFFLRRRIRPASLLLIAASALAFGLAGCGSGGTSTTNTTATSAGTYTIQITGTGTPTTGSTVTAATSFNIIVQ